MRQGRWLSSCFEMYVHLHASTLRETSRKVANAAMLTASERAAAVKQREKPLLSQWKACRLSLATRWQSTLHIVPYRNSAPHARRGPAGVRG